MTAEISALLDLLEKIKKFLRKGENDAIMKALQRPNFFFCQCVLIFYTTENLKNYKKICYFCQNVSVLGIKKSSFFIR